MLFLTSAYKIVRRQESCSSFLESDDTPILFFYFTFRFLELWAVWEEQIGMTARLIMIDLYIETLTGTAFELRVSPFETIHSVKNKIYRLEGEFLYKFSNLWLDSAMHTHLYTSYSTFEGSQLFLSLLIFVQNFGMTFCFIVALS